MVAYRTNPPVAEPAPASVSDALPCRCYIWPDYALEYEGRRLSLGPTLGRIAARLVAARGRVVFEDDLIDALWGDREDGGPLCAVNCLKQYTLRLRHMLEPLGLTVGHEWGGGYWLAVT